MLATATHDHKRGEDVRARLAVLSEMPGEWAAAVYRWIELNAPHRRLDGGPMPSLGDESMLYQMIVGAWPTELVQADTHGLQEYAERLAAWQLKASREAKLATCWSEPNLEYEDAARSFLYAIMADRNGFVTEAAHTARRIGPAGAVNGLAQTMLKLTAPGVPDFYQGSELWDLSLVDPDNRRKVDFARRSSALRSREDLSASAMCWRDGRVKQALIARVLSVRGASCELFDRGDYRPLEIEGPRAQHVVAFARITGKTCSTTVVPRLPYRLLGDTDALMIPASSWQGTRIRLPNQLTGRTVRNAITNEPVGPLDSTLPVDRALAEFPVALFTTE
jgi:maltooligosyltrehalose synthase